MYWLVAPPPNHHIVKWIRRNESYHAQVDQVKWTWMGGCRAEVDAECQQQSIHFVWLFGRIGYISSVEIYIFEWFWLSGGSFWTENSTPEPALRDGRPKSCKMYRKVWKLEGPGLHAGALWSLMGAAGESLDEPGNSFGLNLGSAGNVFSRICWKSVICVFRRHSHTESLLVQVPAPRLQPLGQKSRARSVQNGLGVASRRGQDNQIWQVSAVLL